MKKSNEDIKADYNLFFDIQMGKYLKFKNKSAFSSDEEAENVMQKIIDVYNEIIAPDHDRLDNSDETAKISWFNSVEIDFQNADGISRLSENSLDKYEIMKELILHYDEVFQYLPEKAVLYLMNAGPALEAFGYPLERFEELLQGAEPAEIEKEILRWSCDIVFQITDSLLEKDGFKKEKKLVQAILIAEEKLDEDTAIDVVSDIYDSIEADFTESNEKKNKSKSKSKKKKKK